MSKKKIIKKKYKATKKLLKAIAESEFESFGLKKSEFWVPVYECLVDINRDWTLTILVDEDAIKNNPEYFEEVFK